MHLALGLFDILILVIFVASSIALGVWFGRQSRSSESYLLGNRDLPWWAILGSIVATESSIATVLSVPGIAFGESGFRFFQLAFGIFVGRLVVAQFLLPHFFSGRITSAYEVLQKRFGRSVQLFASSLFLVTRNLGDGLRLFLTAIVMQQLLGWDILWCSLIVGGTTIFYTLFGGMKSIVWNDCIQLVIYLFAGIIVVFILLNMIPGGWEEYWSFAKQNNKLQIFSWAPESDQSYWMWLVANPYSFWAGLIGGGFLSVGTHGTDQMMIQRYLSARNQADAARAIRFSGLFVMFQFGLFLFIGTLLACFYANLTDQAPDQSDKVFAHYMVHHMPAGYGLVGLLMAAIFSASMSTLSSSLGASASAVWSDFLRPFLSKTKNELTPERELFINRILVVVFGLLQVGISIGATGLNRSVVEGALAIAGFSAGILLGVFALGVLRKAISTQSVFVGAMFGTLILLFVSFALPALTLDETGSNDVKVAWPWLALIGSATTFVSASLVDFFLQQMGWAETVKD